jgi:hypothetical protein
MNGFHPNCRDGDHLPSYVREPPQNLFRLCPKFLVPRPQIAQVGGVEAAGLVHPFGYLVYIIGGV